MLKPCEQWNLRLSAYLDGEGNIIERKAVEDHLAACPTCRAAAEVLRCDAQDVMAALHARTASEGFASRVMAQVAVTPMEAPQSETAVPAEPEPYRQPPRNWLNVLLQWGLGLAVVALVASVLFPVFAKPREKSRQATCNSNLRQIALAIQMYAQDNHDTYPAADKWVDSLAPYLGSSRAMFTCPTDNQGHVSYLYNPELSGLKGSQIASPSETLAVWCTMNHSNGMILGFCDGHCKYYPGMHNIQDYAQLVRDEYARNTAIAAGQNQPGETMPDLHMPGSKPPTILPPEHNYGLVDKLMIAYTATMALQSSDVQKSMEQSELLFRQYDGFVLNSEYHREDDEHASATVSGRVPSAKLGQLLVELDGLGRLQSRTVNGEDLTASNIAQVEKLGNLADTQQNLTTIENRAKPNEALKAEDSRAGAATDAGSTRVEQYKLKSRVTLAEVTVQFSRLPKPEAKVNPWKGSTIKSFGALKAFGTWLFTGIIIPLGIWLPVWAPLTILGIVLRRRVLRRRVSTVNSGTVPTPRE